MDRPPCCFGGERTSHYRPAPQAARAVTETVECGLGADCWWLPSIGRGTDVLGGVVDRISETQN